MVKVYYKKTDKNFSAEKISKTARGLLDKFVVEENIQLENSVPLKVHFGEKGNNGFIKPDNFDGIIDFLEEKNIKTCFIETNTIYGGHRNNKSVHLRTAKEHGFTRLPIIIADGESGEDYEDVEIDKKYFKFFKIGKEFTKYKQLVVISHFKGHMMAGFGGAMKQLSMGHASKGGKIACHIGEKPQITNRKCTRCDLCKTRCNSNALMIGKDKKEKSYIDHEKCVGCGACIPICPSKAISIFSLKGVTRALTQGKVFKEKLIEGAFAAQKDKNNVYITFAINIVPGCDCEPRKMKPITEDLGIFVSSDPVAIDKACYDLIKKNGKKFSGFEQFKYAEEIGLGTTKYELVEISSK